MIDITKHKWKLFIVISICGFFIDWFTKYLAASRLQMCVQVPVIGNYFQWQLIYNKGAVFGLNPQALFPSFPINLFFYIFSFIAMVLLIVYYKNIDSKAKLSYWGIALIMPGALGNLFDRIIHSEQGVVDFIRIGISETIYWPIFNMADAYITIGVIMIIADLFLQEMHKKKIENKAEEISTEKKVLDNTIEQDNNNFCG